MLFSSTRMLQFRRITTQKRFIPQIDGLRFVAIASVVLFHIYAALEIGAIPQPIPFSSDLAKRGVELLYGISGFILGVRIRLPLPVARSEGKLKAILPAAAHPA
jgi:peptidoglycan/LPS O-acetylase OafA/YrhL